MTRRVICLSEFSDVTQSALSLYFCACFISKLNEGLAEVVRMMQPCTRVPAELPARKGYYSLTGKAMDDDGKDAGAL